MLTYIILVILIPIVNGQSVFANGPVKVSIFKFAYCPGFENTEIKLMVKMKKISRQVTAYSASVSTPIEAGAKLRANLNFARWADGGWKHNILNFGYDNVCDYLNIFLGPFWFKMQPLIVPPLEVGKCPIPKGNYSINDFTVNFKDIPIQSPFVGRFMATVKLTKIPEETVAFCYQTVVDITKDNG